MDIQFILMLVVFGLALFYVARKVYRSIAAKNKGCSSGCGKCGADFSSVVPPQKNG